MSHRCVVRSGRFAGIAVAAWLSAVTPLPLPGQEPALTVFRLGAELLPLAAVPPNEGEEPKQIGFAYHERAVVENFAGAMDEYGQWQLEKVEEHGYGCLHPVISSRSKRFLHSFTYQSNRQMERQEFGMFYPTRAGYWHDNVKTLVTYQEQEMGMHGFVVTNPVEEDVIGEYPHLRQIVVPWQDPFVSYSPVLSADRHFDNATEENPWSDFSYWGVPIDIPPAFGWPNQSGLKWVPGDNTEKSGCPTGGHEYGKLDITETTQPDAASFATIALNLAAADPLNGDEEIYCFMDCYGTQYSWPNPLTEMNPGVTVEANADPAMPLPVAAFFERPNDIPGILSVKVSGPEGRIRLWRDPEMTQPFTLPFRREQADLTLAATTLPGADGHIRFCVTTDPGVGLNYDGLTRCEELPETLYVEGLDPSDETNDVKLELTYAGTTLPFLITDSVAISVTGFNLQMDENNDGQITPADDALEDAGAEPGKIISSSQTDADGDGVADFADFGHAENSETQLPDATAEDNGRFALLRIRLPTTANPALAAIAFTYETSDPNAMTAVPDANGETTTLPADGALRIWRQPFPAKRSPQSITDGGDYLPPNTAIPLAVLTPDANAPAAVRQYTLHVEGLRPGKHLIQAGLDLNGDGAKLYADMVQLTVVQLDFLVPGDDGSPVPGPITGWSSPIPDVTLDPVVIPATAVRASSIWVTLSGSVSDAIASTVPRGAGGEIAMVQAFVDGRLAGSAPCETRENPRPPTFWEPHPYTARFQNLRVRIPVSEGYHVLRVEAGPNAAGNTGHATAIVCFAAKEFPTSVAELSGLANSGGTGKKRPGVSAAEADATFNLYLPQPLRAGRPDFAYFFRGLRSLTGVLADPEARLTDSPNAADPASELVFTGVIGGATVTVAITALWQPDPANPGDRIFAPPTSANLGYDPARTAVFSSRRADRIKARVTYHYPAGTDLDLGELTLVETGPDTRLFQADLPWLARRFAGAALEGLPDPDASTPPALPSLATSVLLPGNRSGAGISAPVTVRVQGLAHPNAFRIKLQNRLFKLEPGPNGDCYLKGGSLGIIHPFQNRVQAETKGQLATFAEAQNQLEILPVENAQWRAALVPAPASGPNQPPAQDSARELLDALQEVGSVLLVPDYNRDRILDERDMIAACGPDPFPIWINDDVDSAEAYEGDLANGFTGDIPGNLPGWWRFLGRSPNFDDDKVNGRSDMIDFFPVGVNISSLLAKLPAAEKRHVVILLKQPENAIHVVFTNLPFDKAGSFQTDPMTDGFGTDFAKPPHLADVQRMKNGKLVFPPFFIEHLLRNGGRGVILVEGAAPTNASPALQVFWGNTCMTGANMRLMVNPVETMFRWLNLRKAGGGTEVRPSCVKEEPAGLPDAMTNDRHFIFFHGYNVSEVEGRAWFSEVFKRLYQSGSNAKFTAATWYGNQSQSPNWLKLPDIEIERQNGDDLHSPIVSIGLDGVSLDYHENALLAFKAAWATAVQCNALKGKKIVAAHSLGNMIASSAINDHGLKIEKFFLIDAAVPLEAYDDDAAGMDSPYPTAPWRHMRNPDWKEYENRTYLWASEWYRLFPETDARHNLTWRGRFADIPKNKMVNYYSSGEEVLDNWAGDKSPKKGRPYAWCIQEQVKGSLTMLGTSFTSILFSGKPGSRWEGGWGFNGDYRQLLGNDESGDFHWRTIRIPSKAEARKNPFFFPFKPYKKAESNETLNVLTPGAAGARAAENYNYRARLLADAIPALSYAAGRNSMKGINERDNVDLNTQVKGTEDGKFWPPTVDDNAFKPYWGTPYTNKDRWLHNDLRMVSFYQNHLFYKDMADRGNLR